MWRLMNSVFLSAFLKLRKSYSSFFVPVVSFCPSVRTYEQGLNWTDLCELWYSSYDNLSRKSKLCYNQTNISNTCMKAQAGFEVAGEVRTPQKPSVRMKWYQAVTTAEQVWTLSERAIVLLCTYIAYVELPKRQLIS